MIILEACEPGLGTTGGKISYIIKKTKQNNMIKVLFPFFLFTSPMESRKNIYLQSGPNNPEVFFFWCFVFFHSLGFFFFGCVCVHVCFHVDIKTSKQILNNSWPSGMRNGSRLEISVSY